MSRKARIEGAIHVPAAAEDFGSFVADFKARFPADWETLRLCPLEHGIETIIEKLKG